MNAASEAGQGIRTISPVEVGILQDIGFTEVIPEPSTSALILLGAGSLWVVSRRRGRTAMALNN